MNRMSERPCFAAMIHRYFDLKTTAVKSFLHQAQSGFLKLTGDPVAARRMALQALAHLREQQSSALAYFDSFFVFAVLGVVLAFAVLRMKRSVAAKGAHATAE
jgi:MFS transporter, DHA2 family, multidrug resistance protein